MGGSTTLDLGPLTATWNQTGNFNISLNHSGSELQILESVGDTFFGILDVGDLTGADAVYTFSGTSGIVLTDANYSGSLDSIYVNVGESPTGGDIAGSFSGGLTLSDNTVGDGELADIISYTGDLTLSSLSLSDTSVPLTGASFAFDFNNASDRTFTITNSDGTGVANLSVEALITAGNGLSVTAGTVSLPAGEIGNLELANSSLTVTAGSGLANGGSVSLGGSTTLDLGPLTATWNQTGNFNISLNHSGSELQILESVGDTFFGILDVGDLTGADAVYTFSGTSGIVLTDANYSGSLDSIYVNVGESPTGGDIAGSFSGGLTLSDNTVGDGELADIISYTGDLTLSSLSLSDTSVPLTGASFAFDFNNASDRTFTITNSDGTGVANLSVEALITAGNGLSVTAGTVSLPAGEIGNLELANSSLTVTAGSGLANGGSVSLGGSTTLDLGPLTATWNQTGNFNISLNHSGSELQILESVGDTFFGILDVGDLTGADAVYTFSGTSGIVLTDANYSGSLDSIYVNVGESPTGGDIAGSFSGGLTLSDNTVGDGELADIISYTGDLTLSSLSLSDTSVPLTGASFAFDFNNASDRTFTITNSDGTGVANLSVEALITAGNGLSVTAGTVSLPAGEIGNLELANSSLTVTAGSGLANGGSVSLGGSTTLDLGPLTATWNQTGNFNISLNHSGSELQILESVGDTFFGILDVGDLTGADAVYTFSGTSGIVLTDANYSGSLDSIYVNVGESPTGGDIAGSFSGGLTLSDNTVGDGELADIISYTGNLTLTSAIAANGGITFDNSSDTLGAFTAAGTIDMNTNILTNIGSTGTDFGTSGDLTITLDGAATALTVNNSTQTQNIFVAQDDGVPVFTIADAGIVTATGNVNANGGFDVDDVFVVADGGSVTALSIGDISVPLTGASFTFDFNNASDRTLTVTNSGAGSANLSVEALITAGNGLTVTTGTVTLPVDQIGPLEIDDNGITLDAGEDEMCLTYENSGGVFEWQTCGGGSQTPWTADIDADGFDLADMSNLLFRETTSAPAGTDVGIYRDNSGDLSANVLAGKTFNLAVDGTDEFNFSSSGLNMNTNILTNIGNSATDFDTSGGLTLASDLTLNTQSDIRFTDSDSSNYVAFQAPAVVGTNVTWTLPNADGTGCFKSDGAGNVSISACGDTQVQTFSSDGNYTVPNDALMVIIEAWGGGGGGGGATGGTTAAVRSGGAGGGGGSYATTIITASTLGVPTTNVPVVIGTGGTPGSGGNGAVGSDGGVGGATCFSSGAGCTGTIFLRSFGGGGGNGDGTAGNGGGGGGGTNSVGTTNATAATGGTGGGPLGCCCQYRQFG